jgi:hypothetical protein
MNVWIEAPDEAFRVILDLDGNLAPERYDDVGIVAVITDEFVVWCNRHQINLPEIKINDEGLIILCFESHEDAVYFTLVWEGCVIS